MTAEIAHASLSADGAHDFVLTDSTQGIEIANWRVDNEMLGIKTAHPFSITKATLHGGRQEGCSLITIDAGSIGLVVCPTRGMSLYKAHAGDVTLGWDSPVDEVVNPAFIDLEARGGLGFLEGFNEMMVRCGFEWSGHACVDNGRLMTVHGRAHNTPASRVIVSVDAVAPHRIKVKGLIKEQSFKFCNFETWAEVSVVPGECGFHVHDELRNRSAYARDYQILYHSNFGSPLLEGGAHFKAAVGEISPFNDYAQQGLADWQTFLPPTPGFDEMVFNIKPLADAAGNTLAMLSNRAEDRGVALGFSVNQLPALTLWKNTDSIEDGYVTGIEPGSGYAYQRIIEREQGRLGRIGPGETRCFDVDFRVLGSAEAVRKMAAQIEAIQAGRPVTMVSVPLAHE